jgi:heme oxygenase
LPRDESGAVDVLRELRTATATEHTEVETTLGLMDPDLDRERLAHVLTALHGFWRAAEDGLDAWAVRHPDDAASVDWAQRRRAALFAADLATLGAGPAPGGPELPPVGSTDEALGRLYVLEGSTLGGVLIDRHLADRGQLTGDARLRAFSAYGERTGAMWHAFRTATRAHVHAGGDARRVVEAARTTFRVLADWCAAAPAGACA